jgi:glycosyltransferase involved in cell wall biosynthesis
MKVSVLMTTYNHEDFIRESIDSVLMQRTNFKYELVICEDYSDDNTRAIVKEYKLRYPDIIKLNLQDYNTGGKGTFLSTFKMCKGEYIAFLEGDDYWIDEKKLQKQVEFLDKNLDCSFCGHGYKRYYHETGNFLGNIVHENRKFSLEDFIKEEAKNESNKLFPRLLTIMFRKSALENHPNFNEKVPTVDMMRVILLLEKGYGAFLEDVMGTYRINKDSTTQKDKIKFLERWIQVKQYILEYLPLKYSEDVQMSIEKSIIRKSYSEFIDRFMDPSNSHDIVKYFKTNNFNNIAIYGVGTLCNLLIKKIEDSGVNILHFIDKNTRGDNQINIIKPYEVDDNLNVDVIIITPSFDFNNIREFLKKKTKIKIISIEDILS